ncbi:MAG: helix-turn-helix transcriptional regulator [Bacteroidales bacterium]|nr:helix-turn-helix transcriptional regulator [Bacteroidales bacterium]
MEIQEKFGLVIRKLRRQKHVSQEKFALDAGIDRTYIGDIENGSRNISLQMIEKIADYFGIQISEIFKQIEDEQLT